MKKILALLIISSLASSAWADQISLKHDATGQIYGPFSSIPGTMVTIGKASFTVVAASPSTPAAGETHIEGDLIKSLKEIIIPHAVFQYASPTDCISYLKELINSQRDTPINIITRGISTDPFKTDTKTITLELHGISAFLVLTEICTQGGLSMSEDNGMIVITAK